MAQVVRLRTKEQRTQREAAASLAEQLRQLPNELLGQLPGTIRLAISQATHGLHKHARPDTEEGLWPGGFTMLSRTQTKAIWDAIRALPADDRPGQVRHAFDLVISTCARTPARSCSPATSSPRRSAATQTT